MAPPTVPATAGTMATAETSSWLRDPAAIYRLSFARIRAETRLDDRPPGERAIALRVVHACAMPEIAASLVFSGDPWRAGREALAAGGTVLADCAMVEAGIDRRRLPAGVSIRCTLREPEVSSLAEALATTRSAAAVELWRPWLHGAVVVIGNAPTALFQLIERLRQWPERPAVILAFPVGFVGASESKQALLDAALGVPFVTLPGRLGGSAMAAAACNALLNEPEPAA